MLRVLRLVAALLFFCAFNLLFIDFTGYFAENFSWLNKWQFWPALLAGRYYIVAFILLLTLLFGRLYCSFLCPLGLYQDLFYRLGSFCKKRSFSYKKARNICRYSFLLLAVVASVLGFMPLISLLDPYSLFGRMAANLLAPLSRLMGNAFVDYPVESRFLGAAGLAVAGVTLVGLAVLSFLKGRFWCHTVCPVGTLLGLFSRFSLVHPRFVKDKCRHCGRCEKNCRSSCLDVKNQNIDISRCVLCLECLKECKQGALTLWPGKKPVVPAEEPVDGARRAVISGLLALGATSALKAQMVDGGLAPIKPKIAPDRQTPVLPPGFGSAANLAARCSGCQLCATVCKTGIIRSEIAGTHFWQPRLDFSAGFCRPECTRCSDVCPTGALLPLSSMEKSSRQIGRAVWLADNCRVARGQRCTACERHCPSGAILISDRLVLVDENRCLGCGACEYYCPGRPQGAIYVEGWATERQI